MASLHSIAKESFHLVKQQHSTLITYSCCLLLDIAQRWRIILDILSFFVLVHVVLTSSANNKTFSWKLRSNIISSGIEMRFYRKWSCWFYTGSHLFQDLRRQNICSNHTRNFDPSNWSRAQRQKTNRTEPSPSRFECPPEKEFKSILPMLIDIITKTNVMI